MDLQLQVTARNVGAEGVVVLDLRSPSGENLPVWSAGAHIDIKTGHDLVRQYSLCGVPAERDVWRIAVLREPGGRGGSQYVHDKLHQGALVDVRGPRNRFLLERAPKYIFIAGGIGITPLLPMACAAEDAGADWQLHYGGRSRESMAFLARLQDAGRNRVTVYPRDEVGLPDLTAILGAPQSDTLVYVCGPEPLIEAVERQCESWPRGSLHLERFSPKDVSDQVRAETFEVELSTSAIILTVPPDKSILEVVKEAGVHVDYSCEEGTCGSCEISVLEGEIDHRDSVLSPADQQANDTMCICVSRAACPRLVLDL
ncbi:MULTISPECIES: PDR/VanB family oxidoreductase [unclassified Mycobacterium]|uniref:PDR/VanB family oxidoreductase n=1 Tax=unclassified Mycobacterium TaxID=2642494 RepID=UPI0029C6B2BC|nr:MULTISPECIES: PDR/VanB family oxidoreductase [unclassified Mycobacterium]